MAHLGVARVEEGDEPADEAASAGLSKEAHGRRFVATFKSNRRGMPEIAPAIILGHFETALEAAVAYAEHARSLGELDGVADPAAAARGSSRKWCQEPRLGSLLQANEDEDEPTPTAARLLSPVDSEGSAVSVMGPAGRICLLDAPPDAAPPPRLPPPPLPAATLRSMDARQRRSGAIAARGLPS